MKHRSLSVRSWILLIAACLVVVYGVALYVFALFYPGDGLTGHFGGRGIMVDSVPAGSPVHPGDVVVSVNGRGVSEAINLFGAWRRFMLEEAPSGATYTLLRDGRLIDVEVFWIEANPLQILMRMAPLTIIALSFLATVGLIVFNRADDWAATLMAIEFFMQGLNLLNNAVTALGVNLTLRLAWLFSPLDLLSFSLGMSLVMHVLLVFPERKWLARHVPQVLYGVHSINILIALLAIFGVGSGTLLENRSFFFGRVLYPLAAVELLVGLFHLIHTYVTSRRPGVRNQIRWLMWGTVLGPLPWLLLYNIPVAITGQPLVPLVIADFSLILVPLAFFFSVTGRGLMVVDTLINRSLVYGGLSVLLIGFYFLAVGVLEWLLETLFGVVDTTLVSLLVTVMTALVATPLRARLQVWVDRAFYRRWLDARLLLREIGARLSTTLQLEALVTILVDEIPQRLSIAQAALLLRQDDASFQSLVPNRVDSCIVSKNFLRRDVQLKSGLSGLGDAILHFPAGHPLVTQLELSDVPLALRQGHDLEKPFADLLRQQWEIALPLWSHGNLLGIYLLGARLSGDLYGKDEVETLTLLGQQIAITLENAHLYHQIETHSHNLQALVSERTSELEMTNKILSQERDRLNVIIENMADGLLVVSPEGTIVLVNPVFEEMVACSRAHLLDRPLNKVVDFDQLVDLVGHSQLEPPGHILSANCELNGRVLRASSTALTDGSGTITVLRDVTHEVAVDRMKTEFISTVSHELRTPLTSVLGFTKLIIKFLDRDVGPVIPSDAVKAQHTMRRVLDNLAIINIEGERLTDLINDVLDIAKMESGELEWGDEAFDLLSLVGSVLEDVRELAAQNNNVLHVDCGDALPQVVADPKRIRQVLFNLLSNAAKFTRDGEVSVRACAISPQDMVERWQYPSDNVGGVLVAVQDTGVGIPKAELPNLFQRFKQIREDVLINKPEGTGLGLAICREIVTHYDGHIWVESELGEGSTVQFVLPLMAKTAAYEVEPVKSWMGEVHEGTRRQAAISYEVPVTILIVDDEAHIRDLLHQELQEAGYHVLEAVNGTEALTMARRYHPSLILLDVMMPDISGFDVTKALKADSVTASIPILILSVLEDREYGLGLGADAYLTKPVETGALLDMVTTLVAHATPGAVDLGPSVLESVTGTLRQQGFEVVEVYDAREGLVANVAHADGGERSAQPVDLDSVTLGAMLSDLEDIAIVKIVRFQEHSRARAIIVLEGTRAVESRGDEDAD